MLNSANSAKFPKKLDVKSKAKPLRTQLYKAARWIHVYMSTATLMVILFFALTGFLLNHPDWVFGSQPVTQEVTGTLPETMLIEQLDATQTDTQQTTEIDWLQISEYFRQTYNISGQVSDYWNDEVSGQINFYAPGYTADVYFDMQTGDYTFYSESQGALAFMKDLHKGSNTGASWNWLIDATALFLIIVSLSGLVLTLFLKKLRMKGMLTMFGGGAVALMLLILAI